MILFYCSPETDLTRLKEQLRNDGHLLEDAYSDDDVFRVLQRKSFHLIVSSDEYAAPLLNWTKERPLLRFIPVLAIGERKKEVLLSLGAADALSFHTPFEELLPRVRNLVEQAKDYENQAFRDKLTQAYNRRYFEERLKVELIAAQESRHPISLAFIDADKFKSINDTYGHDVGDLVLQGLARLLQQHSHPNDVVARFGGEEFVILMPDTEAQAAVNRIEGILDVAHREPVAIHGNDQRFITFSSGLAQWIDGLTTEDWIKAADQAVYLAKKRGRDRVVLSHVGERTIIVATRNQTLVAATSSIKNVQVIQARTDEEVLKSLQEHTVDICILDASHETLEVFLLVREIKKLQESQPALKTILLSDSSPFMKLRAQQAQVDRVVEGRIEQVVNELQELLNY